MERVLRLPGSRRAEIKRDHPEAVISCVEGILRAESFAADGSSELVWAYTWEDLAAKLDGG